MEVDNRDDRTDAIGSETVSKDGLPPQWDGKLKLPVAIEDELISGGWWGSRT